MFFFWLFLVSLYSLETSSFAFENRKGICFPPKLIYIYTIHMCIPAPSKGCQTVPLVSLQRPFRGAPKPQEFQQVRLRTAKVKVLGRAAAAQTWMRETYRWRILLIKKGTGNVFFVMQLGGKVKTHGKYLCIQWDMQAFCLLFLDQIFCISLQLPSKCSWVSPALINFRSNKQVTCFFLPSWELTYPIPNVLLKMVFLFSQGGIR